MHSKLPVMLPSVFLPVTLPAITLPVITLPVTFYYLTYYVTFYYVTCYVTFYYLTLIDGFLPGSEIATPSFNSSSHIVYPTIRDALFDVHLKLTFRADTPNNALLLYNGFSRNGDGDFIAISIRDEHVHFQFDTGTGDSTPRFLCSRLR